jgi:NADH:ubiquinone oxidoreductase subunit E
MSIKKISKQQPEKFEFNDINLKTSKRIISKYPEGKQQSAVISCTKSESKLDTTCSDEVHSKAIKHALYKSL